MSGDDLSLAVASQLRSAVALLAAGPDEQRSYLSSLGVWPSLDELGLEFEDVYPSLNTLTTSGYISVQAREAIDEISNALDVAQSQDPNFWLAPSLDGHLWDNIRRVASKALTELGVP